MKKIFYIILLINFMINIAWSMTKGELIKLLEEKKVVYYQNPVKKWERISIDNKSIITNNDLKNFFLLDRLEDIDINNKNITNEGVLYLSNILTIKAVHLAGPNINDETLKFLNGLIKLESLIVGNCNINGSGLKYIADKKNIDNLDLGSLPITDDSVKNIKDLINIRRLLLNRTRVTDEGVKYLINLKKVYYLILSDTKITDKSVPIIIEMMGNRNYDTFVEIYKTRISRQGVKDLKKAGITVNCDYEDLSDKMP